MYINSTRQFQSSAQEYYFQCYRRRSAEAGSAPPVAKCERVGRVLDGAASGLSRVSRGDFLTGAGVAAGGALAAAINALVVHQ